MPKIFCHMLMIAGLASGVVTQAIAANQDWSGDGGVSDFYRWNQALPAKAGALLRQQAVEIPAPLPNAGAAAHVLYTSTSTTDDHSQVYVSGAVYLPKGKAPAGGWPIVAWAHGTTGVADVCAPSWHDRAADRWRYLNAWLGQGFAVVATDYRGLGTPGVHPYLNYEPAGRDVLDSVRAALGQWPTELSNRVLIVGQSQGGGSALGAALIAPDYAPDVHVIGTVATGPAIGISDAEGAPQIAMPPAGDGGGGAVDAAFEVLFVLGTMRGIEPQIDPTDWVSDAALPLLKVGTQGCFHDVINAAKAQGMDYAHFYKRDITPLNNLQKRYSDLPNGHIATPVFVGTGLNDQDVDPRRQYNTVSAMCKAGVAVSWHQYPGRDHLETVNASLVDSEPFAQALLAGQAPTSTCAALKPPPSS